MSDVHIAAIRAFQARAEAAEAQLSAARDALDAAREIDTSWYEQDALNPGAMERMHEALEKLAEVGPARGP